MRTSLCAAHQLTGYIRRIFISSTLKEPAKQATGRIGVIFFPASMDSSLKGEDWHRATLSRGFRRDSNIVGFLTKYPTSLNWIWFFVTYLGAGKHEKVPETLLKNPACNAIQSRSLKLTLLCWSKSVSQSFWPLVETQRTSVYAFCICHPAPAPQAHPWLHPRQKPKPFQALDWDLLRSWCDGKSSLQPEERAKWEVQKNSYTDTAVIYLVLK